MRILFSPLHPRQHLLFLLFFMMAVLTGVRWSLSVPLICISFMARDGEHFFMFFGCLDFFLCKSPKSVFLEMACIICFGANDAVLKPVWGRYKID
jgi:hypothetical protein